MGFYLFLGLLNEKKIKSITYNIYISFSSSLYSKNFLYLTPETTGYLYSIKSQQPIANYHGYMDFDSSAYGRIKALIKLKDEEEIQEALSGALRNM